MFYSRNKKNNVYPCKPHFFYTKVGFVRVKITRTCFCDEKHVIWSYVVLESCLGGVFEIIIGQFSLVLNKNIYFYGDIQKITPELSPNTPP